MYETRWREATDRGCDAAVTAREGCRTSMTFSDFDKLKALAIVRVFETSQPFGDYAACVVLNDGAGVSYGISQFTHRSGSLAAVVEKYLANDGAVGRAVLEDTLHYLKRRDHAAINVVAGDERFKKALRAAAITREMRAAQEYIAFECYLKPAIRACESSGFELPLSLAVVYDSMTHGSWEKIRDRVRVAPLGVIPPGAFTPKGVTLTDGIGYSRAATISLAARWLLTPAFEGGWPSA